MVRDPLTFFKDEINIMAKFKIQRKLYNEVVQQEEENQQPVQQPMSGAGQEFRSAAISTLAPMAITGLVNGVSGASKGTKAALLGGALTAGLGYAAHKGYLGAGAQNLTNKVVGYGKSLVDRVKAMPQKTAAQQQQQSTNQSTQPELTQQAKPAGNFDPKTGKPTSTGYKNYKDLTPEAQARIQQENAAKKQQKQQQKAQRQQAAAGQGQQQQGKTVTIKRKLPQQPANVGQKK